MHTEMHRKFTPVLLLGLAHDYPAISDWLLDNLNPAKAEEFRMAERQCFMSNDMYDKQDVGQYFTRGIAALADPVVLGTVRNTTVMGHTGTPRIPWYVYHVSFAPLSRRGRSLTVPVQRGPDVADESHGQARGDSLQERSQHLRKSSFSRLWRRG
jgi:hypothetical protein